MILLVVGLLYFASRVFTGIFSRFGVPDVLLLMIIGILAGPVTSLLSVEFFGQMGPIMATMALAVILFESGIDTKLSDLKRAAGPTSILTFPFFVISLTVAAALFLATGQLIQGTPPPLMTGLLFGAIVAGTSSAVVIPLVNQLKPHETIKGSLVLESALTDVLCIVLTLSFIEAALDVGGEIPLLGLGRSTAVTLLGATILGLVAGLVWIKAWQRMASLKSSLFPTIFFVLIVYGFAELLKLSGAISALVFGLSIANFGALPISFLKKLGRDLPRVTELERNVFRELVFLLKTFFFIYLGLNFRFDDWKAHGIAFSILVLYGLRFLCCRLLFRSDVYTGRDRLIASALIPRGLAAAVLAGLPRQAGLEGAEMIESIVFAMVLQSIVISSGILWWKARAQTEISPADSVTASPVR